MTNGEKSNLLNELLEYEEKNDIGNLTMAERREFQQWVSKALEQEQEPKISPELFKQVTKEREIAIEQLHELGYEFGEKIEPTTKNDLAVDCISRVKVIDYLCKHCPDDGECFEDCDDIKHLRKMPSVTPQEPFINKSCISTGVCEHDKNKVLDKIRAEIETDLSFFCFDDWGNETTEWKEVKAIIEKYKEESEGEE